jgi:dienelactone hydrolase
MWPFGKKTTIAPPSGPAAVGTTRFDLNRAGEQLPVQAWYPADSSGERREAYLDDVLRSALADLLHVPKFLLPQNPSFSTVDAPPRAGRCPVLVFNHGFGSFQKQSSTLLEELASHGFVVLSVGHPGDSLVVQFGDGTTRRHDAASPAWQSMTTNLKALEQNASEVAPLLVKARAAKTPDELKQAMEALARHPSYAPLLAVRDAWLADTRAVLDALDQLDAGEPCAQLKGLLDTHQVGALGHSLGGVVSAELAMSEPRVLAAMNLDGAQLPPSTGPYALRAPVCFLYGDTTRVGKATVTNEGMNDALVASGAPGSCSAVLVGANHLNFTDMNNLSMASRMLGSIDRSEMARELRRVTVGFFARHLKGSPTAHFEPSPTLKVLSPPKA